MESDTFSVQARYLFPVDRPPLRDGCMIMRAGQIVAVGYERAGNHYDLGDSFIIPALVNAHTHLEFSRLTQPLGSSASAFPDWIRSVVDWRRKQREISPGDDWREEAVRLGIQECEGTGTAALGEIATLPFFDAGQRYRPIRGVVFVEMLGLAPERESQLLDTARDILPSTDDCVTSLSTNRTYAVGLSPHAPYTVSLSLLQRLVELARQSRAPLAMHLAETREELELLQTGGGPFVHLLEELGAWRPAAFRSGLKPLDYLQLLSAAERALVIHGNYLSTTEHDFIAQHRERLSVVYCPRTHAYFGHEPYPLQQMLRRGIPVALGTDSRASTKDLSMWEELRFAAHKHPEIAPEQMLSLATISGAQALGLAGQVGTLTSGTAADFLVLRSSANYDSNPYDLLFQDETRLAAVWIQGAPHHNLSSS